MWKGKKYIYDGGLSHEFEDYCVLQHLTGGYGAFQREFLTPCSLKYYYSTLNPSILSRILSIFRKALPSKRNIKLLFYLLTISFLYTSILLKGSTWARGVHHLTWGGGSKKGGGLTNVS